MSVGNTGKNASDATAPVYWNSNSGFIPIQKTYHELGECPVVEIDLVEQLKGNIARLSDLHGRLSYMMTEIGQLTRSIK